MDLSLKGKVAIVTGASQGIGAAIAIQLANQGADVITLARSRKGLIGTLQDMANGNHEAHSLDLSDTDALVKWVSMLADRPTKPSILVNNSGGPKGGPLLAARPLAFQDAFQQHIVAAQVLAQALVPAMQTAGYGRVINIISTSVKVPIMHLGVSNTIRGAMASWAKTLANEEGHSGVTVNNILPGYTQTPRLENLADGNAERRGITPDQVREDWIRTIPAKRLGEPSEPAALAGFLASPAAAYINGVSIPVDGGRTGSL